ncbi:unnamed protein product [Peniophora sp. CBMAI 1063]|nr:unnamed protein product [Peniophora sp. CBMAI 1063]
MDSSAGLLDLPDDLLKVIVEVYVKLAPPTIGRRAGWLTLTWICRRLRYVVCGMPRLFAEHYTEYPGAQEVFRTRSGDVPLWYHLTPLMPRMRSNPPLRDDKEIRRMTLIRQSADFASCSQIWILRRGDVTEHLKRLVLYTSLTALEEIRASVEYEQHNAYSFIREVNHPSFDGRLWAPKLLRAYFDSCWLPIVAFGLRVLSITWDDEANTPRPHALAIYYGLLMRHKDTLEDLTLSDALDSPPAPNDVASFIAKPSFDEVRLPNLRRLVLSGCALSYMRLLGALVVPPTTTVQLFLDCELLPDLASSLPLAVMTLLARLPVPTSAISAVKVVMVQTEDGLLDILVSGYVLPLDEVRLGRWYRPKVDEPAVCLGLLGLDSDAVEWVDEIAPILRKLAAGVIVEGVAFDFPDWCYTDDEDWAQLFGCLPGVRTVRSVDRILEAIADTEDAGLVALSQRLAHCSGTTF